MGAPVATRAPQFLAIYMLLSQARAGPLRHPSQVLVLKQLTGQHGVVAGGTLSPLGDKVTLGTQGARHARSARATTGPSFLS